MNLKYKSIAADGFGDFGDPNDIVNAAERDADDVKLAQDESAQLNQGAGSTAEVIKYIKILTRGFINSNQLGIYGLNFNLKFHPSPGTTSSMSMSLPQTQMLSDFEPDSETDNEFVLKRSIR